MSHDWYYRDISHLPVEERARCNFDHPAALETTLLAEHISALSTGSEVSAPTYDFNTHARGEDVQSSLTYVPYTPIHGQDGYT